MKQETGGKCKIKGKYEFKNLRCSFAGNNIFFHEFEISASI
jgi:hypothetical protein